VIGDVYEKLICGKAWVDITAMLTISFTISPSKHGVIKRTKYEKCEFAMLDEIERGLISHEIFHGSHPNVGCISRNLAAAELKDISRIAVNLPQSTDKAVLSFVKRLRACIHQSW